VVVVRISGFPRRRTGTPDVPFGRKVQDERSTAKQVSFINNFSIRKFFFSFLKRLNQRKGS